MFLSGTMNCGIKRLFCVLIWQSFFHRVVEREDDNTNLNVNRDHRRIIVSIVTYYHNKL